MAQDVEATVLKAAQANVVTAAAQRVLEACKHAGKEPPEQVCSAHESICGHVTCLDSDIQH